MPFIRNNPGLGNRDLILHSVVAVFTIRWVSASAVDGMSAILCWVLAVPLFFVPLGTAVQWLTQHSDGDAAVYSWTSESFGPQIGFQSAWLYWCSNLTYFPALLYFAADNTLHFFSNGVSPEAAGAIVPLVTIGGIVIAYVLGVVGFRTSRWFHDGFAIANMLLVGFLGLLFVASGRELSLQSSSLLTTDAWMSCFNAWPTIAFAFAGIEAVGFVRGELTSRPARYVIPVAGLIICILYLAGTTILVSLGVPNTVSDETYKISGLVYAFRAVGEGAWEWVGSVVVSVLVGGSLASLALWLSLNARLPFAVSSAVPRLGWLGVVHPKWGTPTRALGFQAVGATVFTLIAQVGASVESAYGVLLATLSITTFVPYLSIFAAVAQRITERDRNSGSRSRGFRASPLFCVVALGALSTLVAIGATIAAIFASGGLVALGRVATGVAIVVIVGILLGSTRTPLHEPRAH